MMKRVFFAFFFIIIFSACVSEPSGDEIVVRAFSATSAMESYAFNISSSMSVYDLSNSSPGATTLDMAWVGVVDEKNERMHMVMSMSADAGRVDMEQYIIDDIQYMRIPSFGWVKNKTAADVWDKGDLMLQDRFNSSSEAELLGLEEIGGVDCYVLEVNVSEEEILGLFMDQISDGAISPDETLSVRSVELLEWVEKETFLLRRAQTEMEFEREGMVMRVEMNMSYSGYGESFDIEIPDDARSAFDLGDLPGFAA